MAVVSGDEILAVNGDILHGMSHEEAISIFKRIRSGPVVLQIGRRGTRPVTSSAAAMTTPTSPSSSATSDSKDKKG
jgi:C-terminal processing protease CtpA/Prc